MVVPEMNLESPFSSNLIMSVASEERVRVRRSATASAPRVSYGQSSSLKLRLKGSGANFLQVSADGNSLTVGTQQNSETVCFTLHNFIPTTPYPEGNGVMVLESPLGGKFIQGANSGSVSLVQGSSSDLSSVHAVDERFFLLFMVPGEMYTKVKHIQSGLLLASTGSGISLVAADSDSDSVLYQMTPCNS
ncbi:uncharacterized protein LOC122266199 [Penaeus japonicus]|uniref:uncharacterized protein LOC122266199 n=1 Tax=Penaeus japonicus TaxID=27405 RepID=UPI001C70FAC9|nr:uncharacterized protein LOC122266199 [Penaeus japonicus]